jgi:hypothetical protein
LRLLKACFALFSDLLHFTYAYQRVPTGEILGYIRLVVWDTNNAEVQKFEFDPVMWMNTGAQIAEEVAKSPGIKLIE